MPDEAICAVDDIADHGAAGLVARVDGIERNLVAARKGREVHLYVNRCPHAGHLLDMVPGRFFAPDAPGLLRCGVHGAQFRIEDGYCVSGPCEGEYLVKLATEVRDGRLYVRRGAEQRRRREP